jgi:hypothetical protein
VLLPAWLAAFTALGAATTADPAARRRALPPAAAAAIVLAAAVFLLHLRVAVFFAVLLALTVAGELWRLRRAPRARRLLVLATLVGALGAVAVSGPRLINAVLEYGHGQWATAVFHGGLVARPAPKLAGDPEYFAFSRQSLGYLFADGWPLALVLAATAIALLRRNRVAWLFAAWAVVLLALGEAHRLSIPLLNVTNLGAVLILLYLPASLLVACAVAELLAWTRAGAGAQTAVLLAFLALGALGAPDRVRQIEPSRFFVTDADLRGMAWLREHVPAHAIVAVRSTFWLPHAPHGVDAGSWIPYLTRHKTTVGPMIANLQPQYANWATEMSRRVRRAAEDEGEWAWLWKRGVSHVYVGAIADPAEAVALARSRHLALRYADGGVFIFEVDPGGGVDDQAGG